MMDSMRNAAKSWVAKLLIGLLAVSFGVWGIADVFRGYTRGALATVGAVEITGESFGRAFNQYLQNLSRQTGQTLSPDDARKLGIDRAVFNNLIQSAAIDSQAQSLKLAVSDAQLAKETTENRAFQDSAGKFDKSLFQRLLAANGLSEAGYFANLRQDRLRQAITGTADGELVPANAIVEAQYRYRNEQRDARYFSIVTTESEVEAPTADEIKKEFDDHPRAYTAPEYRSIAVMKVEPADISDSISLTDEEIAAGYERYKSDFFTPEKRTILQLSFPSLEAAQAAKAKLDGGEDFLALAKEQGYSEADITFADKTKADFLDPAIAEAAFGLAEGAISEPIKGALATVILKAAKITPEHQPTLDEVKAKLRERLKLNKAAEEIQSIYDSVEDSRAAQMKFEDIAKKVSIPFQLIAATDATGKDKDGKEVGMPDKTALLKAAFDSDVGVENDAISTDEGYVWYEVREVMPSAVKPFDQVKEQAKAAVIAMKMRVQSEEKAGKLVERARTGAKLEDLAAEAHAEIKTAHGLKRNETGDGFDAAAVAALFAVPDNGFAYAVEPDGKGAKIMQSQPVLLPAFDPASAEAKTIREQIKEAEGRDLLFAYLGELQKEAGVTINETLWRQITGTTNP